MRHLPFACALAIALVPVACGPAETPSAVPMRPLEERRAIGAVTRIAVEVGTETAPGRTFDLGSGARLKEDVRFGASPFGVAYVTAQDRAEAGASLPAFDPESTTLRILRPSEDAIVLLLHEQAYRFDPSGTTTATPVAAEKTVERDAYDFLIHVVNAATPRPTQGGRP